MRIVSKFKDYYDGIQRYGQDKAVTYPRTPVVVEMKREYSPFKFPAYVTVRHKIRQHTFDVFFVGFCDKVYLGLRAYIDHKPVCLYDAESVHKHVETHCKDVLESYNSTCRDKDLTPIFGYGYGLDYNRDRIENLFKNFEKGSDSFKSLFKDHPIFVCQLQRFSERIEIEYNALLRGVEFFRVKQPHDAFQELYRWVSNRGNPEKKMPVIPDEMKIQAHGFDKYSFRREKVE